MSAVPMDPITEAHIRQSEAAEQARWQREQDAAEAARLDRQSLAAEAERRFEVHHGYSRHELLATRLDAAQATERDPFAMVGSESNPEIMIDWVPVAREPVPDTGRPDEFEAALGRHYAGRSAFNPVRARLENPEIRRDRQALADLAEGDRVAARGWPPEALAAWSRGTDVY